MVRDVGDVVRVQPQVERVHHGAGARNREVRLQVRMVIPHERAHALAALEPQAPQRSGERAGAPVEVGVAVTVQGLVGEPGDDLRIGEEPPRAREEVGEREREIHRRALHVPPVLLAAKPPAKTALIPGP